MWRSYQLLGKSEQKAMSWDMDLSLYNDHTVQIIMYTNLSHVFTVYLTKVSQAMEQFLSSWLPETLSLPAPLRRRSVSIHIAFKLLVSHLERSKCYTSKESATQVRTKCRTLYANNSRMDLGGVPIKLLCRKQLISVPLIIKIRSTENQLKNASKLAQAQEV